MAKRNEFARSIRYAQVNPRALLDFFGDPYLALHIAAALHAVVECMMDCEDIRDRKKRRWCVRAKADAQRWVFGRGLDVWFRYYPSEGSAIVALLRELACDKQGTSKAWSVLAKKHILAWRYRWYHS